MLWLVGLITAGMTSFYMFRLWFKTFFGEPRFEEHELEQHGAPVHASRPEHLPWLPNPTAPHGVHESPWIMLFPLIILAILSVIGGWVGIPAARAAQRIEHFLDPVFANGTSRKPPHRLPALAWRLVSPSSLCSWLLSAFYVAYLFYYKKPGTAAALAERNRPSIRPAQEQVLGR